MYINTRESAAVILSFNVTVHVCITCDNQNTILKMSEVMKNRVWFASSQYMLLCINFILSFSFLKAEVCQFLLLRKDIIFRKLWERITSNLFDLHPSIRLRRQHPIWHRQQWDYVIMGNNVLNPNYIDSFSPSVLSSVGQEAFLTLIMFLTKFLVLGSLWKACVVVARFFYLSCFFFFSNTL